MNEENRILSPGSDEETPVAETLLGSQQAEASGSMFVPDTEDTESPDQIPLWEDAPEEFSDQIPLWESSTVDEESDSFEVPRQALVTEEASDRAPDFSEPTETDCQSEPQSLRSVVDDLLAEDDYYTPADQIPHRQRRVVEEAPPRPVKKSGSAVSPFVEFVEIVVGALVAAILVLTLICRTGVVEGDSMVPTMHGGDRYVISDLFYTPEQGDVVVFRPEIEGEDELWIKRIVAVEGQKVYIDPDTYQVFVDDKLLDEPYLGGAGTIPHTTENPVIVPEGCVYVLGDNRAISHDSRYADLGCVEVGQLAGRVVLRFWPLEDFGFCE